MADEMRELGEVFGLDPIDEAEPDETEEEDIPEEDEGEAEEQEDEEDETEEDESDDEESDDESEEEPDKKSKPKDKKKAQQNFKFAEMRQQNKKQTELLKRLGKAIGLDEGTDVDTISAKVEEMLLERQAKETNIPVETLQRINQLESLVQENQQIKLEKETTEAFTSLIERYDLDEDEVNAFTQYLIDNDKNPLDGKPVDLEAEYLKLHYEDLVKAAVDEALSSENQRKEKAKKHAAGKVSEKKGDISKDGDYQIDSVRELNDFLSDKDL